MNSMTSRSYAGKSDWEAIAHLLNTCEAINPPEKWPSLANPLSKYIQVSHQVIIYQNFC